MNWKKITDESVTFIRQRAPVSIMRDPTVYNWWLSQTYHFVKHSTALLGFALPFLRDEKLRAVFEHHLGEESRHDLLALKDIEKLGMTLAPRSHFTEAFYHSQYYRIQFEGGTSLLGYILFLENIAVTYGKDLFEELNKVHSKSTVFLKVHAEEDVTHVARAIALIEKLPQVEQEIIQANYLYTQSLYSSILDEGRDRKVLKIA